MKKFRLLFALYFLFLSQAACSRADTAPDSVAQPQAYRELVRQARAKNDSRTAAHFYLRAAEAAPDNEQRYWALVKAGKEFHEGKAFEEAIAAFTRAEKLDGIIDLARFDAALQAAYTTRTQINAAGPAPRNFAPAYAAYERLFTLPGLELFPRKLAHAGLATVYSDDGKHLQAALEYEKGEQAHPATDNGLYQAAYEELARVQSDTSAFLPIKRMAAQVAKRKIYDLEKQLYRNKTKAEISAEQRRWTILSNRHNLCGNAQ